MAETHTFWNGEPCEARKVLVTVADDPAFPAYWARSLVGTERAAVEVTYGGATMYLDDATGEGWNKVTVFKGSPRFPHSSLTVEPGSVRPAEGGATDAR